MLKKIKRLILASLIVIGSGIIAFSCNDENYLIFDENYSGIYFTEDSIHYSFGILPLENRFYIQEIPVKIMGVPESRDRIFAVEILPSIENTNPREGIQYEMESSSLIIPADSIIGTIPLKLLRDGLAGSEEEGYTRYELRLRLIRNENFVPTLSDKENNIVITFDNSVEKPSWFDESLWISKCGEWHPLKLIKLMEFFHTILKEKAPSTYQKMVADIGENWEKVEYGWPTDYNYTVKKYMLIPCYEYFRDHPEHGITDFPNPTQ